MADDNKKKQPPVDSYGVPQAAPGNFGSQDCHNWGQGGFWSSTANSGSLHTREESIRTGGFSPAIIGLAGSPWSSFGHLYNPFATTAGPAQIVGTTNHDANRAPATAAGFAAIHGFMGMPQPTMYAAHYGQNPSQVAAIIGVSHNNNPHCMNPSYEDQQHPQQQQEYQQQKAPPIPKQVAPGMPDEQLMLERAQQQRQEVPQVAQQNVPAMSDDQNMREQALRQIDEAIRTLPMENKAAYLEAREKALPLVETESDPMKFFRVTQNQPWDAAKRLVLYWKERKAVFGPERAFLPLILTGQGALTREDTLTLRAGYPALLPETIHGRKVLFSDRNQFLPTATDANRFRCLFYIANILSEDPRTQTKEGSVLCLVMLTMPRWKPLDHKYSRRVFALMERVFPIKSEIHFLNKPPKHEVKSQDDNQRYRVQDLITRVVSYFLESKNGGDGISSMPIQIHFERGQGELLDFLLTDLGLTRQGTPAFLGGEWTFVQAAEWCRQQAAHEKERFKSWFRRHAAPEPLAAAPGPVVCSGVTVAHTRVATVPGRKPCDDGSIDEKSQEGQGSPAVEEEKDQRTKQRERNLIYSRRKRDRRRRELTDLKDEHDQLWGENDALKDENARLEAILDKAREYLQSSVLESERAIAINKQQDSKPAATTFTLAGDKLHDSKLAARKHNCTVDEVEVLDSKSPARNCSRACDGKAMLDSKSDANKFSRAYDEEELSDSKPAARKCMLLDSKPAAKKHTTAGDELEVLDLKPAATKRQKLTDDEVEILDSKHACQKTKMN